jgi:hypothetical protein
MPEIVESLPLFPLVLAIAGTDPVNSAPPAPIVTAYVVPVAKSKADLAGLHLEFTNPPAPPPPPALQEEPLPVPPAPPPATTKYSVDKYGPLLVVKAPEPENKCCVLQETHETVPPPAL